MTMGLQLISDGGSSESRLAACACIIREPEHGRKLKLLAYLGEADCTEAELAGGLLGFSLLSQCAPGAVTWYSDHAAMLDGATSFARQWEKNHWRNAANEPIRHRGMWQAFLRLSDGWNVSGVHVPGHGGHRDQEACDRACRWGQEKGVVLLAMSGEGPQGKLADRNPGLAWQLVDARTFIQGLRCESPPVEACMLLAQRLSRMPYMRFDPAECGQL